MNFLAHAFLSGTNGDLLAGNLFGDFIKGKELAAYSLPIRKGVDLHRKIDRFTDSHDAVREARGIFFPHIRHYGAVVNDVLYDHFLGKQWALYHNDSLENYVQWVYTTIETYKPVYPHQFGWVFERMRLHNWLLSYRDKEYLFESFYGLARRSQGFEAYPKLTAHVIQQHYDALETGFLRFFPDLQEFVRQEIAINHID